MSIFALIVAFCAPILPPFFAKYVAQDSVPHDQTLKATSKIFMAISAGMTLGIPLKSYIASHTNLATSFIFFTILNAIALLATIIFIPSQKQVKKSSQKEQFATLTKPIVWVCSLIVIAFIGTIFGFYNYMSEFLFNVSQLDFNFISILLLIYGLCNVLGNSIAGKVLINILDITLKSVPVLFVVFYLAPFFLVET